MKPKKIFAVDDDNDILEVIKIILEDEGYEVDTLNTGEGVMDRIDEIKPDLILLDVMLGGMDGRDICKSIKGHSIFKNIPVIMISASHNLQSLLQFPGSPNDFLPKPFDIDNLVKMVGVQLAV
ncbi:response regulator [Pedobacter sp. MC2016-14]|uniref:response regulator n=1 Tax=Pedobacter sp. MC2016-14 TaxID=2897327 RepID=UPI001E4EA7F2|nr:response regulator [Pedobacter sp. MC2016-14]MCD0488999.1 response regulator [Pedobacter sp. MC2016-14]